MYQMARQTKRQQLEQGIRALQERIKELKPYAIEDYRADDEINTCYRDIDWAKEELRRIERRAQRKAAKSGL
jgi:hypothetical protein